MMQTSLEKQGRVFLAPPSKRELGWYAEVVSVVTIHDGRGYETGTQVFLDFEEGPFATKEAAEAELARLMPR